MGRIVKTPIIIEFNGLPGSGKTTISEELCHKLSEIGYKAQLGNSYAHGYFHNAAILLYPNYWRLLSCHLLYLLSFKSKSIERIKRVFSIVNNIKVYNNYIKYNEGDLLIMDQGILQGYLSLAHKDRIPSVERLKSIIKKSFGSLPFYIVNCQVSGAVSENRVMSRPKNGCRLERMDRKDRIETIRVQEYNLKLIRESVRRSTSTIHIISIDTENDIESNINSIIYALQ